MTSSSYKKATLAWEGQTLSFSTTEANPQAKLILTDLKGWFGGVGVKGEDLDLLGIGSFLTQRDRSPRNLTLEATLIFASEDLRNLAGRNVSAILGNGGEGTLTVDDGGLVLSTKVFLDGDISHAYEGKNALRIQVPLIAPDPRLYSETKTYQIYPAGFGEGLEYNLFSKNNILTYGVSEATTKTIITNQGTYTAHPVFVTDGNFPSGLSLSDGQGKSVELLMPITQASPVRIDMRGSVTVNGKDFSHLLSRRQWFSIPPGQSLQPRVTSLQEGDGFVNIELSDTYI